MPTKMVDKEIANLGDIVTFTITLQNPDVTSQPFTSVWLQDTMGDGYTFVNQSVYVNGNWLPNVNPNTGFAVGANVPGGSTLTVTFQAQVTSFPNPNPIPNTASLTYTYVPPPGDQTVTITEDTNTVNVLIIVPALEVSKGVNCAYTLVRGTLYFEITVTNTSDLVASQIVLTDIIDPQLDPVTIEYSIDGGTTWLSPWTGSIEIPDLNPNENYTLLIRGNVTASASGNITNQATVQNVFCVPVTD